MLSPSHSAVSSLNVDGQCTLYDRSLPLLASRSPADTAYQEALQKYEENLNSRELESIKRPKSLQDVLGKADELIRKHEGSKAVKFYDKLGQVREKLRPLDVLLQGACKSVPFHGGEPIWAAVQFVFNLVQDSQSAFEAVFDFFTEIGHQVPIIQTLADTFRDSPMVMNAAQRLFAALIEFWSHAVKSYRGIGYHLFKATFSLKPRFEKLKGELDTQFTTLKDAATAQHMQNSEQDLNSQKGILEDQRDGSIYSWLRASNYVADFKKAQKKRYQGTCTWILAKPEYQKWKAIRESGALLVIYGIPGTGKTILSSFLVENALDTHSGGEKYHFVLYHYFKADDDTKNTPVAAIRSLLDRLYDELSSTGLVCDFRQRFLVVSQKRHIDFDDLWELLYALMSLNRFHVTIVLDALDECIDIKSFAKELRRLVQLTDAKVIATSRKTGDHVNVLPQKGESGHLEIVEDDVNKDIVSFVRYKVSKMDILSHPAQKRLKVLVIDQLSKKENHKGMFLWAYLICKDLKLQRQIGAIKNLLNQLPGGLTAVYTKILQRLNDKPMADRDFVRLVLRWIAGSLRPLRWHELDQALEIDRFRPPVYEDDDEYEEQNLYSRKDIVMICGSLVQYSGLMDGDTVGLIHLSTRDFLRSQASALEGFPQMLECYLVNALEVNSTLGRGCLRVLLSDTVRKNEYFSTRKVLEPPSQHLKARLLEQSPLFDYAALFWAEYVCGIHSIFGHPLDSSSSSVELLAFSEIFQFTESMLLHPFSLFWLEEYVRDAGTEVAGYTIKRLRSLDFVKKDGSLSRWFTDAAFTLNNFAETISRHQQVIHICFPTSSRVRNIESAASVQEVIPFESDESSGIGPGPQPLHSGQRSWIHYDHKTRSVFSTDVIHETMRVNRRKTEGFSAYRATVDRGEDSPSGTWKVRSAIVNRDATYMAVTFYSQPMALRTVCWSIREPKEAAGVDQWAQIVLVDKTRSSIFRGREDLQLASLIQFSEHNQLIAPSGIWDLATEEHNKGPASIWRPENPATIEQTCFSHSRAARIRGRDTLEVLELLDGDGCESGSLIGSYKFPVDFSLTTGWDRIFIRQFSRSGKKAVLTFYEAIVGKSANQTNDGHYLNARRICFVPEDHDKGHEIELTVPRNAWIIDCQFSTDEESIVASIRALDDDANAGGISIVLWNLLEADGVYKPAAETVFMFKSFDSPLPFTITPKLSTAPRGGIMLAFSDGKIADRTLTEKWTTQEDIDIATSRLALSAGGKSLVQVDSHGERMYMMLCSKITRSSPCLTLESWSIKDNPAKLGGLAIDLEPSSSNHELALSLNGKHLAAMTSIIQVGNDFDFQHVHHKFEDGDAFVVKFSHEEDKFARVSHYEQRTTIGLYKVEYDLDCKLLASIDITEGGCQPQGVKVAFDQTRRDVFAYSYWTEVGTNGTFLAVADVEQGVMTCTKISEDYMADISFSLCGKYLYSVDRSVPVDTIGWPIPTEAPLPQLETAPTNDAYTTVHPTILEEDLCYIYESSMWRVNHLRNDGLVYLDHKLVGDAADKYSRQVVGVLPDTFITKNNDKFLMVWPKDPDSRVKLIVLPAGEISVPTMIKTGNVSGALLASNIS